ncbi:hypothetical protein NIES4102_40970 (plasmid) [Chondrocystis sp. NIES-4102]|nr:hypothetical protein NIES4102_40970 [Chondrocystis sp. NIES-4102]
MQASKFLFFVIIINILSIDALVAQNITTNSINFLSNSSTILVKKHSPQIKTKFTLENYSIEHQGSNTLDITIQYSSFFKNTSSIYYKKHISTQVERLLKTYPNKNDYWEVMNYYLTKKLIQQNPELSSVTITLVVYPNQEYSYHRSTTVTQTHNGEKKESWHFNFLIILTQKSQDSFMQIDVYYTYKNDFSTIDYPDFIPIYQQIKTFIVTRSITKKSWTNLEQQLKTKLLQQNPMFSSLSIELKQSKPIHQQRHH